MEENKIQELIQKSIDVKLNIAKLCHEEISFAVKVIENAFRGNNKLLICGNGGSAADSQHIAAEFVSRFLIERKALFAIALNCNTSSLTAIANDYNYDFVFSRQVEAFGTHNDVLLAISTSGNSKNVLEAALAAKKKGMIVVGLTGKSGGKLLDICDVCIRIPSEHTPNIQESHIMIGHIICEIVEENLFK
ncbi:D-sedoheptulose 7-phosphate isomerase [Pigmentibacter sp. JX0631]|uniref:D-sedoheptulose-7-phosphate isomerase n=1 Tax=Pigmentibacter sp. JX0631 TaxID=2976982 RepID=UPI0024687628|nr:D-sedoheptulose 7-phosphate isomerase [Pigmentibacter sp. JX0631]WGL60841.1 D-sedoheptulose 7-phosphate isomerase [Pigmentibacter sp. JX0631]